MLRFLKKWLGSDSELWEVSVVIEGDHDLNRKGLQTMVTTQQGTSETRELCC